jgi:hypothetical protein
MTTSQEAPALIQYACERCKTRFVLPPSRRKLSLGGKLRSLSMGLNRTFRYHEGLGSSYDTARRQLLAKMDDEAYQSFVQSFRFCHECRQFVCNECWSTSRRSCLTCVAKSMTGTARPRPPFAPTGPEIPRPVAAAALPSRRGRVRRDAALVALGLAVVLVGLEGGSLLMQSPGPTAQTIYVTEAPSVTPSGTPVATILATATPLATPSVSPTAVPIPTAPPTPIVTVTPSPTAVVAGTPTPKPTPKPTAKPTPVPTPIPVPTPLPEPVIRCSGAVSCTWNHWDFADSVTWYVVGSSTGTQSVNSTDLSLQLPSDTYTIYMKAVRGGVAHISNSVDITVP